MENMILGDYNPGRINMFKSIHTLVSIIAAGLILGGCAAGPSEKGPGAGGYNFRDTRWGMSPVEVEAAEAALAPPVKTTPESLLYRGTVMEKIPVEIAYHFKGGQLVRGTYFFRDDLNTGKYSMFFYILAKKYGDPVNSGRTEEIAQATWEAGPTEIDILARGKNFTDYRPGQGTSDAGVKVDSIDINYYDRSWFRKSAKRIEKEEKEDAETSRVYHRYIGDWVELFPDYYTYDKTF